MDIPKLSNTSLQDLHALLPSACCFDDAAPADKKPYGVREHPDWRGQADAFEAEMKTGT